MQASRFGPAKTCRFPGLDPLKRAGFQVWIPHTCRFPDLDPPQNVLVSRFGPPKRAGFQVGTPKTCKPARLGGSKPANGSQPGKLHVFRVQTWKRQRFGGTCTFWGVQTWKPAHFGRSKPGNLQVQTWKPAHFGGPNLETSTFWGSKPDLETCTFWGSNPGNSSFWGCPNLETCGRFPGFGPLKRAGF